jgi:hypothetical protein
MGALKKKGEGEREGGKVGLILKIWHPSIALRNCIHLGNGLDQYWLFLLK